MVGLPSYFGDEDDEEKEEVYSKSRSSSGCSWDVLRGDSSICGKSSTDASWCSSSGTSSVANSKKGLFSSRSVRLFATLNNLTNSPVFQTKSNSQRLHSGKIGKRRSGSEDDSLDVVDNFSSGSNGGCSPSSWSSVSTIQLRLPSWSQERTPMAIRSDTPLCSKTDKVEDTEDAERKKAAIRFVNNSGSSRQQKARSKFVTLRHSSSSSLAPPQSSPYHPKLSLWKKHRRKNRSSVESTTTTTSLDSTSSLFNINPLKVPTFAILESPNSCIHNCSSDDKSSNNRLNTMMRSSCIITDFGNKANPSASMNTQNAPTTYAKCTVDSTAKAISSKLSSEVAEANLEASGISNSFVGEGQGKRSNLESTARTDTGEHQELLSKSNKTFGASSLCVKIMYDPLDDEDLDDDNDELSICTKTNSPFSKCSEDQITSSIYRFDSEGLNKKADDHSESSMPAASHVEFSAFSPLSPPDVSNPNNTSPTSLHPPPLHSSSSAAARVPFRSSQPLSSTNFLTSCASRLAFQASSTAIAPRRYPPPLVSSRATTALVSPSGSSPTWTTPSCTTPSASLDDPSRISISKAKRGEEEQGPISLETETSGVSWAFGNSPLLSPSSSRTSNRESSLKSTAPNRYRQSFAVTSTLSETTTKSDRSNKNSRRSRSCSSHDVKTNTSLPSFTKCQSPPRPNYIRLSRKCSEDSLRIEASNGKTEAASFEAACLTAKACPLVSTSLSSDGSTPTANGSPLVMDTSPPHLISTQSSLRSTASSVALSALSPSIPIYRPCIRDEANGNNREQDIDKRVLWHSWGGASSSSSPGVVSIGDDDDDPGTLPGLVSPCQSPFDLIQFLHSSGIAELCHSFDSGRGDLEDDAIGDRKEGQNGTSLSTIFPPLEQSHFALKPMLLPLPLPRSSSAAAAESVPQQWAAVTPHFGHRRCGFSIATNSEGCSIISEQEGKNRLHQDISSSLSFPSGGTNTNEMTAGGTHDPINHMEKNKNNRTLQSEEETIESPMMTSLIEQPLRPPTPASLTTFPSSVSILSSFSAPSVSSSSCSSTIPSDSSSSSSMSSSSSVVSYSSASSSSSNFCLSTTSTVSALSSKVSIPPFPSITLHTTSQRRSVSEPRRGRQQFLLSPSVSTLSTTFLPSFGKVNDATEALAENVSTSFADPVSFQSGQVPQQRQQSTVASISDFSEKTFSFPSNLSSEQLATRDPQECLVMQTAEDFSPPVARGFSPNANRLRSASLPPFSFQVATRENMDSNRERVCGNSNTGQVDAKLSTIDYSSSSSSIYTTDTSANRSNGHHVLKGIHDCSFSPFTSTLSPSSELNSAVRHLYSSASSYTHTGISSCALLSSLSIAPLLSSSSFSVDSSSSSTHSASSSSSSPYSCVELLDTRHLPPKIVQTKWGPVQVTTNGELKLTFRARSELAMFYGEEPSKQIQDKVNTPEQKAEKRKVSNSDNAEYMSGENDDGISSSVTVGGDKEKHMKDKRREVPKKDKTKQGRRSHYKVMDMAFVVEGGGLFVRIEEPQTGRVLKRFHVRELPPRQMLRYDYARDVVDAFRRHTAKIILRRKGIGTFRLMSNIPQPYFLASLGEVFLFIKQVEIQKEVVNFRTRMGDKLSISVEDLTLLTTNPISSNESDVSSSTNKAADNENEQIIMKKFLQATQRAQISLEGIFQSWHITLQAYKDCLELEDKNQRLYSQTVTQQVLAHLEKADEQWLHEDKNVILGLGNNTSCMNVEDLKRQVFNRYFPVVVED